MHLADAICAHHTNLQMQRSRCICLLITLRLLDHDFEESFLGRSEVYHVVRIVVDYEDVCDMEVALLELLVVVDLVQMVREIGVGALLLERVRCNVV